MEKKKKSGICIAPESLASDVSADSAAIGGETQICIRSLGFGRMLLTRRLGSVKCDTLLCRFIVVPPDLVGLFFFFFFLQHHI